MLGVEVSAGARASAAHLPSAISMPGLVDATSPAVLAAVSGLSDAGRVSPWHVGDEYRL